MPFFNSRTGKMIRVRLLSFFRPRNLWQFLVGNDTILSSCLLQNLGGWPSTFLFVERFQLKPLCFYHLSHCRPSRGLYSISRIPFLGKFPFFTWIMCGFRRNEKFYSYVGVRIDRLASLQLNLRPTTTDQIIWAFTVRSAKRSTFCFYHEVDDPYRALIVAAFILEHD